MSTSNAKSSKAYQVQVELEEYGKVQPADFAGTYKICHYSATRNSASGFGDGVYHACPGINVPDWAESLKDVTTFTKKDDFGAYQSDADGSPSPGVGSSGAEDMGWAGYASGNVLKMTSFGVGAKAEGEFILFNDTPDTKTCTLYRRGVMECETVLTEYCSAATVSVGSCAPEDEGKWQNTYIVKAVHALAGATCPAPPAGFCETNNLPEDPPFGNPPNPLEAEFDIEYSGCDYNFTFSFVHDVDLPVPSGPEQCNLADPAIASDGKPYLASREFLIPFSSEVYSETGIAEISKSRHD